MNLKRKKKQIDSLKKELKGSHSFNHKNVFSGILVICQEHLLSDQNTSISDSQFLKLAASSGPALEPWSVKKKQENYGRFHSPHQKPDTEDTM